MWTSRPFLHRLVPRTPTRRGLLTERGELAINKHFQPKTSPEAMFKSLRQVFEKYEAIEKAHVAWVDVWDDPMDTGDPHPCIGVEIKDAANKDSIKLEAKDAASVYMLDKIDFVFWSKESAKKSEDSFPYDPCNPSVDGYMRREIEPFYVKR